MSAVITWLGRVLRNVQESPPSSDTKIGAVALADPPGLGVKAEAAMSCGLAAYRARNGSASCQVSPESETGIRSTTRTPVSLAGGACDTGASQATHTAAATTIPLTRMTQDTRTRNLGEMGAVREGAQVTWITHRSWKPIRFRGGCSRTS